MPHENTNAATYWTALAMVCQSGPRRLKKLMAYFPDPRDAWQATPREFARAGLKPGEIETICANRQNIDLTRINRTIATHGIHLITIDNKKYPPLLREIFSPPAILFYRGVLPTDFELALAVVGTRKTSPYGRAITPSIVGELSQAGLMIVSGLAIGIDTLAHEAALEAGGLTVAVLGCGLDQIYPTSNRLVAEAIIVNGGALISEYPPGTPPLKQHFPARNRIISGLSRGVLVIEGSEDSGSLITARCALEQNREVLAVPGNISSPSAVGPNNLIKMGARPVTAAGDVLAALDVTVTRQIVDNKKVLPETPEEEQVLPFLSTDPVHIDELVQKSKLNTSIISATLTMMEMKGKVRHLGGMYYTLA